MSQEAFLLPKSLAPAQQPQAPPPPAASGASVSGALPTGPPNPPPPIIHPPGGGSYQRWSTSEQSSAPIIHPHGGGPSAVPPVTGVPAGPVSGSPPPPPPIIHPPGGGPSVAPPASAAPASNPLPRSGPEGTQRNENHGPAILTSTIIALPETAFGVAPPQLQPMRMYSQGLKNTC